MRGRDAALDGIRALAALGVWLLHVGSNTGVMYREGLLAWMMSRLGVAVPIFFLLSGLLLYRPWARAVIENTPRPRTPRYLWRRVLRVMPLYWLVTGLTLWAWSSFDLPRWLTWMLLAQSHFPGDDTTPDGLYQMWTLPVEMSFYLLLPLIAWALHRWARRGDRPVRLLAGIGVLPLVSVATVVVARGYDVPQLGTLLPYHLVFFACGMALAVLSVWIGHSRVVESLAPQLLVLAGLVYVLLSTELAGPRTLALPTLSQSLWRLCLEAAVAVLVVTPFALAPGSGALRDRVLGHPVTAYFGRISYGFFLWHVPVITLQLKLVGAQPFGGDLAGVAVVSFVVTTLLSVASHHLVELPVLRLVRNERVPDRPREAPTPVARLS
ncbi:acyltransferase family protein [Nonomuraea maritima]|uniref:acyltransferase family protein n=1 Tax=Nonomuraea maritima TaxID=683260 RepID=UPI00371AA60E